MKGDSECHLWSFKETADFADEDVLVRNSPIMRYGSHTAVVSW